MKNRIKINPVLVHPFSCSGLAGKSIDVFAEEIKIKTGRELTQSPTYLDGQSNIVICCESLPEEAARYQTQLDRLEAPGAEGFRIFTVLEKDSSYSVFVVGTDPRGTFYGAGKLLRELYLTEDGVFLDAVTPPAMSSTPHYPLRGHQLGYRDKQNTCPCWDQKDYERYIRDLGLFGSNAIELVAPHTDDYLFSRKMKVHPMQMMCDLSEIIHSYGMDVWMWYPNMADSYTDPAVMEREIAEREEVYSKIPYLDAVLIPAGDPGELPSAEFFRVTAIMVKSLHKYHPNATVWVAPQCCDGPDDNWTPSFYEELRKEPDWLYGVCFGPWSQDTLWELHEKIPEVYKNRIRFYPDITHNLKNQFPPHEWDHAFGIIEGRECNNTRPKEMKYIHNMFSPLTLGSITYSEGIHDDVNKMIWGQQDWDPSQSYMTTLREYVRYFIDPALEDDLSVAFAALEQNWLCKDPIEQNRTVDSTYRLWMNIDAAASPKVRENFRYQMGLLRAISDYFVKYKRIYDDENEKKAAAVLQAADASNVDESIREAAGILRLSIDVAWDERIKGRMQQLADSLHEKCGIKLTTKRHGGQYWDRGAYLDFIDFPLSNAMFYLSRLRKILPLQDPDEKLRKIYEMLHRTDPGEGGIYCNAGSPESLAHFDIPKTWEEDPSLLRTPYAAVDRVPLKYLMDFEGTHREMEIPYEWFSRMFCYYDTPMTAHFSGLDPQAKYKLRIVYMAAENGLTVRLTAGDGVVIHNTLPKQRPFNPIFEFELPQETYTDGNLTLTWKGIESLRGVAINELFIIKEA